MDARAVPRDADVGLRHFEIVDLDHAAGQQAVAGLSAGPSGFALGSLEFECRRSGPLTVRPFRATDGQGRDR